MSNTPSNLCVADDEDLGRRVFSETAAKRARNGRVRFHIFREKEGVRTISVDRLTIATSKQLTPIVKQASEGRTGRFQGWAFVLAGCARQMKLDVVASPRDENPFHADIELPKADKAKQDDHIIFAKMLADIAKWHEPSDQESHTSVR